MIARARITQTMCASVSNNPSASSLHAAAEGISHVRGDHNRLLSVMSCGRRICRVRPSPNRVCGRLGSEEKRSITHVAIHGSLVAVTGKSSAARKRKLSTTGILSQARSRAHRAQINNVTLFMDSLRSDQPS